MSGAGFDWLNVLAADSSAPPPPVSFGLTPSSSSVSLTLPVSQLGSVNNSNQDLNRDFGETKEDLSVPLSLRADQLTAEEAKTYLRWYNDIVVRRGTNVIRLEDVFAFLRNFRIPDDTREILGKIFREVNSLNVGEFFALLRVIAHTILGQKPLRRLIQKPAPIPKPKSILSAKRVQEHEDDEEPKETTLDLDSFTQMLMTGETPRKKKIGQKRIKFSDQVSIEPTMPKHIEPVKIDLSLPMDQLMKNLPKKQQEPINEEEELKDIQVDRFQNIKNVDSALIHGTPSNIPSIFFDEVLSGTSSPSLEQPTPLAPNHTGPVRLLSPNHTGPVPMTSGLLQQSMTGDYFSPHTYHLGTSQALQPIMTGSLSSSVRQQSPLYQSSPPMNNTPPPPPPERRLRYSSSPQPVDHQVTLEQLAQATLPNNNLAPAPPPQRITSPNRQSSPMTPAPPPPRRRGMSQPPPLPPNIRSVSLPLQAQQISHPQQNTFVQQNGDQERPPLPPKVARNNTANSYDPYAMYQQQQRSGSTGNILDDLKRLQNEVDRLNLHHG